MGRMSLVGLLVFSIWGCCPPCSSGVKDRPPVLTSVRDVEAHVGQIITIRGLVTNTKIPTILRVDVASDDPDLRGQVAEATGLLRKYVVTPEHIQNVEPEMIVANRGPGVFYRLQDVNSDASAAVRPVVP